MSHSFGQKGQVSFRDEAEMYKFIGYLTKSSVSIQWERNNEQGAWGQEGRMAFSTAAVQSYFPNLGYSAGVGSYNSRLNCNAFVEKLVNLGFSLGNTQNINSIRNNIPTAYQNDFDLGCQL
jgi:hypothetical protein